MQCRFSNNKHTSFQQSFKLSEFRVHASVTKQYNLVPANGRWCLAVGKVTLGLASHWPCVTDISGSSSIRAQGLGEGDEQPPTLSCGVWRTLPFTFVSKRHRVVGIGYSK